MQFNAYGNAGIEGTHKGVLEFTQRTSVIPKGASVVGTRSDFDPEALAALATVSKKIKLTLSVKGITETITGDVNKSFLPGADVIIRKGPQCSPGTLLINADKSAADLSKRMIELLKNPEERMIVTVERLA
ncbi:MAG: DUF371 domain-containing protein [Candidatus Woesearchaeota archaeon]